MYIAPRAIPSNCRRSDGMSGERSGGRWGKAPGGVGHKSVRLWEGKEDISLPSLLQEEVVPYSFAQRCIYPVLGNALGIIIAFYVSSCGRK